MADRVAVLRFFAANLTCECHWCVAPYRNLVYDRTFMVAEYPGSEKQFGGKSPRIRIGLALPQMPSGQCGQNSASEHLSRVWLLRAARRWPGEWSAFENWTINYNDHVIFAHQKILVVATRR
jgi:hypothetical protein